MQLANAADYPSAKMTNSVIHAELYLPDAQTGFYRGTRFDWSGVVYSFRTGGHNYYGPWFNKTDPTVHDFVYRGDDIVAGPCSAIAGPVDEFAPLGYNEAQPGGTFVKIGIGALRRDSTEAYDNYHLYPIADGGHWTVKQNPGSVEFVQTLKDDGSGYAYVYEKVLQLTAGKAEMTLTHRLKNTGRRKIQTTVYNHNFLVLDGLPPGPGVSISVPFQIQTPRKPPTNLAEIRADEIVYRKPLAGHDVVAMPLEGFGTTAADNAFRIENKTARAGIRVQSNQPLLREALWSIRSVIAVEPFITISVEPGAEFSWSTVYTYYNLP